MTWSRCVRSLLVTMMVAWWTGVSPAKGDLVVPADYVITADLHGIPDPALLYAIAIQESGRFDPEAGRLKPWPWALNVEGQGYFYRNMTEVWDALASFIRENPRHIGIGLVQVTWPFNADILWDPYTALEPTSNLALGARILRDCYDRLGDWWQAVGCYHSPTAEIAEAYRHRVYRHWLAINPTKEATPS